MGALYGKAVVHGKIAYFSRHFNIYSYKLTRNTWSTLKPSKHQSFSLVVLDDHVTTIGGISRDLQRTKALFSLSNGNWKKRGHPMPTYRVCAAAITTPTHLLVAGGRFKSELQSIDIMDRASNQWSTATFGLPLSIGDPQLAMCSGQLYLCNYRSMYSTSMERLVKNCANDYESLSSTWKKLSHLPLHMGGASLAALDDKVVAVGGHGNNNISTGDICSYDEKSDSWTLVSKMPIPRGDVLTAPQPGNALLIVGGWSGLQFYDNTDLARINLKKPMSEVTGQSKKKQLKTTSCWLSSTQNYIMLINLS